MLITRRSMLGAMLAAAAGPAIVRASSLMMVKPLAPAPLTVLELGDYIDGEGWAYFERKMIESISAAFQTGRFEQGRAVTCR